jgi:hypothetical protein
MCPSLTSGNEAQAFIIRQGTEKNIIAPARYPALWRTRVILVQIDMKHTAMDRDETKSYV